MFEITSSNKNLLFFNINLINKFFDAKISKEKIFDKINPETFNNAKVCIIGLDLLSFDNIFSFFSLYGNKIHKFPVCLYFFSLDFSSENLSENSERKKNLIKSKLQIILAEKTKKHNPTKFQTLVYCDVTNIPKLSKDIGIYEINVLNNTNPGESLDFDKLSIYLKEHKDIFESKTEDKKDAEPSSTFKLSLNENELQAKNEIILPYLKNNQNKENIITIDQEDLNELYEEDPDGDLDI